jgi:hypothetical protein
MRDKAIFSLYPSAARIEDGANAFDAQGNKIVIDDALVQAEIARLQAEYDAKQYQRNRAAEYPSFAEQFDTLYHGGYDAWKATIDSVKTKYPKGA